MLLNTTYDHSKRTARVSFSSLEGEVVVTVKLVDIVGHEPQFEMFMESRRGPLRIDDLQDFDMIYPRVLTARNDLIIVATRQETTP